MGTTDAAEFKTELKKLADNFNYPPSRFHNIADLFWYEFETVPMFAWRDACRDILLNDDRFPVMHRLKDAVSKAMLNAPADDIIRSECVSCEGTGLVTYLKEYEKLGGRPVWAEYAFRCSCANGARITRGIHLFSERHAREGFRTREQYEEMLDLERRTLPAHATLVLTA